MSEAPDDALNDLPAPSADPFAASLADLEAHVAAAEGAGEAVAPEARRMLAQLRELSAAIRALTASMDRAPAVPDDAPSADPASDQGP